ncbi:MAG: DUF29 domain-containing protein [Bacteroidales bacterium]|nr:DUF29 domain-containing protein [Bacteroidales bacterium]
MTPEYKADFYTWAKHNAQLLRSGQAEKADWENIAEELDSMGNSERRSLKSHLRNLLMHLLKWQYQPQRRGKSWRLTISNSRMEVADILKDSPGLKPQFADLLTEAYTEARRIAAAETGISVTTFPELCPYSNTEITELEFWPG